MLSLTVPVLHLGIRTLISLLANSAAEAISSGMQQAGTALNNGWSQVKNTAQQAGQALSNQIKSAENAISNCE